MKNGDCEKLSIFTSRRREHTVNAGSALKINLKKTG